MDDSLMEEDVMEDKAVIAGKLEKAHPRAIISLTAISDDGVNVGVTSIGHDSAKMWSLEEDRESQSVTLKFQGDLEVFPNALQAAECTADGSFIIVVGIDSQVREIKIDHQIDGMLYANDYLDAVHVSCHPKNKTYVTVAYSTGTINDMDTSEITRKEPLQHARNVSVLRYSRDGKYIGIGHLDGVIEIMLAETFKTYHKYEVHSMRIRKIEFLPDDQGFLSGCDDRLIKLHSLTDFANEADPARSTKAIRVFSAHDTPITGLAIDTKSGGTRFASSSMSGQIFIWHIELTTPIMNVVNDHTSTICALTFSPTGRHLLSGGDDSLIEIYSIPGYGGDSPRHVAISMEAEEAEVEDEEEEQDQVTEKTIGSPLFPQDPSQDSETEQEPSEPQKASSDYQEYRPYAEPRTPPPDDDEEDIGDYVYGSTTQQEEEEAKGQEEGEGQQSIEIDAPASVQSTEYDPEAVAYNPEIQ